MEKCWLDPHFPHECNSEHIVDRTSDVPMQVVCKLTEADKPSPEELLSERIVELAVDGLSSTGWNRACASEPAKLIRTFQI